MTPAKFGQDGKRIGSEITESHSAWCESCGWHGPKHDGYGSREKAENNGVGHDIREHGAAEAGV